MEFDGKTSRRGSNDENVPKRMKVGVSILRTLELHFVGFIKRLESFPIVKMATPIVRVETGEKTILAMRRELQQHKSFVYELLNGENFICELNKSAKLRVFVEALLSSEICRKDVSKQAMMLISKIQDNYSALANVSFDKNPYTLLSPLNFTDTTMSFMEKFRLNISVPPSSIKTFVSTPTGARLTICVLDRIANANADPATHVHCMKNAEFFGETILKPALLEIVAIDELTTCMMHILTYLLNGRKGLDMNTPLVDRLIHASAFWDPKKDFIGIKPTPSEIRKYGQKDAFSVIWGIVEETLYALVRVKFFNIHTMINGDGTSEAARVMLVQLVSQFIDNDANPICSFTRSRPLEFSTPVSNDGIRLYYRHLRRSRAEKDVFVVGFSRLNNKKLPDGSTRVQERLPDIFPQKTSVIVIPVFFRVDSERNGELGHVALITVHNRDEEKPIIVYHDAFRGNDGKPPAYYRGIANSQFRFKIQRWLDIKNGSEFIFNPLGDHFITPRFNQCQEVASLLAEKICNGEHMDVNDLYALPTSLSETADLLDGQRLKIDNYLRGLTDIERELDETLTSGFEGEAKVRIKNFESAVSGAWKIRIVSDDTFEYLSSVKHETRLDRAWKTHAKLAKCKNLNHLVAALQNEYKKLYGLYYVITGNDSLNVFKK